jgi:four helix bundle protein
VKMGNGEWGMGNGQSAIGPRQWSVVMIQSFKDLDVWQISMQLAEDNYRLTQSFPVEERYGLTSQIRRAVVSIPANIAEGYGRDQTGNYIQFLRVSLGSTSELETLLTLATRLQVCEAAHVSPLIDTTIRVSKMLRSLIRSLESQR